MPNRVEGESNNNGSVSDPESVYPKKSLDTELLNWINEIYHGDIIQTLFYETQLKKTGLLSEIEKFGILPIVENPNPYDPEHEVVENEQWSNEHPEEMTYFKEAFQERDNTLRLLFIGSLLSYF